MKVTRAQVFGLLKSLPLIRFALMLGGGMVATAGVGWIQLWLLAERAFPNSEPVWLARIQSATWLGLGGLAIIAIVMIALAFGRIGRVAVQAGGVNVDIDFDEPDAGSSSAGPEGSPK